jgi:hypothetical protein
MSYVTKGQYDAFKSDLRRVLELHGAVISYSFISGEDALYVSLPVRKVDGTGNIYLALSEPVPMVESLYLYDYDL